MIDKTAIETVSARQIFDSRGNPTVEASVILSNGVYGIASVPSGASTGKYEACELRDCTKEYNGKGVEKAVNNIREPIHKALKGKSVFHQTELDHTMIALDGTENKSALGANAILAVSLACARAGAAACGMDLYRYIGGINGVQLPVPMMNILNGGAHASNNLDIQEFMIMPVCAGSFHERMKMCVEIYAQLGKILKDAHLSTTVGDEGGYAPDLSGDEQALELIIKSIEAAGYQPGKGVGIALDAAASEWYQEGIYLFPKQKKSLSKSDLIQFYSDLIQKYPILSIEDPLAEEDFDGFAEMTRLLGKSIQIVGDDLFVTNPKRLQRGISEGCGNAILVKPNQIGTLTETMETVCLAKENGYKTILSHRSGETEDTTIADLAVALNAGQIKTGAPARTERVCKYNRLLKIEDML